MSTEITVGHLLEETARRDAIHFALAPVVADTRLFPCQEIGFVDGSTEKVCAALPTVESVKALGIVDPFLKVGVQPGQRFWMFLFPNTVTGMRHQWEHPAFTEAKENPPKKRKTKAEHKSASHQWLKEFADHLDIGFNSMMEAASEYANSGYHTVQQGSESWRDNFYGHEKEFWHHYQIETGLVVKEQEANPFCCTC
jgi:hypothetical protein